MKYYFLVFFITISTNLFAQKKFLYQKLEIPNISSDKTNSIFIDNKNFSWISTSEGLNRFDGTNNIVYRSNPFDSSTVIDNNILSSFQVDKNGIFISSNSGLDYFNYNKFNFTRIQNLSKPVHFINDGNLLFSSTKTEGVFIIDVKTKLLENLKFDPRNPLSISSSVFDENQNDILFKHKTKKINDLWIGTTYGLNKYNLLTKSNKRFYYSESNNGIPSNYINDIFDFNSELDRILVATDKGIASINLINNKIQVIDNFKNKNVINIFRIIDEILILSEDGIYKILEVNNGDFKTTKIIEESNLKFKKISSNEFIIWSNQKPLLKKITLINNIFYTEILNNDFDGINDISSFNGAIYLSTNSGIFKISEKINNIFSEKINNINNEQIISFYQNDYFKSILTKKKLYIFKNQKLIKSIKSSDLGINNNSNSIPMLIQNNEFIAIGENRLHLINLNDFSHEIYQNSKEGFNSIQNGSINNLKIIERYDNQPIKELWISLENGISIFDLSNKKFTNFKYNIRSKNKFPKSFSSILNSNNNFLWITNESTGLYKYNSSSLELVKQYIFDIKDKKSISSASLTSLYEYENKIFIGSKGDGLFIYENDSTGFENLNYSNGLISNTVNDFFETDDYLFISTTNGLNYLDYNFKLKNLNEEDGLIINNYLKNGITYENGFLNLYSKKNIQKIDLNNIYIDIKKPLISLTGSNIIDENFDISDYYISKNKIDIDYKISNIELNFSSPSYYKSNETKLFYRLTPFNNEWIKLSSNKNIKIQSSYWSTGYINNSKIYVPFGNYKLEVKALNSSGIESDEILHYNLNIIAPWYMTTIAIITYIILFIFIIYMYVKYNKDQTKKIMEEKRKEDDLKEARDLQMSLLAKENPLRKDLDISTYIRSSTEVGGDYYDFIELKDGSLLVICGDATGHGTASGMMVSITKAGLLGIDSKHPDLILKNLNTIIKKVDIGRLRMSLNLIHFKNGSIRASSAAMPPIYHYEKINKKVDEIQISNLPLGGLMNENFKVINKKFSKDDVIVMISDGLPEAPNKDGELLDYKLVKECIQKNSYKTAEEIKDDLVDLSDKWLDGIQNPDDITIVVCKKKI